MTAAAVTMAVVAITAGCTGDDADDSGGAAADRLDLSSILLPEREHPEGSMVNPTVTLKAAAAQVLPGTGEPPGVAVEPRCMSYFAAIGGLGSLEGWYQSGFRADGAQFINLVARVPDAEQAVDMIRLRVAVCNKGIMTIHGWPPSIEAPPENFVTGTLSFAEQRVQLLPEAETLGLVHTVTFHEPESSIVRSVRAAWQCSDRPCSNPVLLAGKDDLLIYVFEPSDEIAAQVATALFERAEGTQE